MKKLLLFLFLIQTVHAKSQSTSDFPYAGGIKALEKDLASIFVEASDSIRIYFVEFYYEKSIKNVSFKIHGVKDGIVSVKLLQDYLQINIAKWEKRKIKKRSIIIPIFIEGVDPVKLSVLNNIDLLSVTRDISKSFSFKKCILTKPFLITKSEYSYDIER